MNNKAIGDMTDEEKREAGIKSLKEFTEMFGSSLASHVQINGKITGAKQESLPPSEVSRAKVD
ncbi:hypothetical protein [Pseudomonas baetica]|uniref:hypothetical protein n=1 Tax=Pseudomonas baetica TaxID=674054 RepID=UPI002406D078|nr:hypothetical protein [Pseudomonas baetica]MDF9778896.1 hypothetical protein [Pseudomonas baetica]